MSTDEREEKLEAALYATCQAIRHLGDVSSALSGMGSGLGFGEHGEDAEAFVVGLRARIKVELARLKSS